MLDAKNLTDLVESVSKALPPGFGELPENAKQNLKTTLSRVFENMDLVSREEFDIQTAVLEKTRAKLETLEQTIEELQNNAEK